MNQVVREMRGRMLDILYLNQNKWASDDLIAGILHEGGYVVSVIEVQGHLRHLQETGFVEIDQPTVPGINLSRNVYKLSLLGVDFVEGNAPDDVGVQRFDTTRYAIYPEIRGWILHILRINLPQPVGDRVIVEILHQGHYIINEAQLENHLIYLSLKELITFETVNVEAINLSRRVAKLSKNGVNFLEDNLGEIPGVKRIC
jgi:DNA-binding PadR family transcriptional regulator